MPRLQIGVLLAAAAGVARHVDDLFAEGRIQDFEDERPITTLAETPAFLETNVDAAPGQHQQQPETEGGALAATQEELRGMMDRVRGLSKQFRRE